MGGTGGMHNPAGSHLMVCISKTTDGEAMVVPIVSRHDYSDTSCLINVGDHPFIKHESCADYGYTRKLSLSAVNEGIANQTIVLRPQVSKEVLVRLQIGLVTSDKIEPWAFDAACGDKLKLWLSSTGHI
jgi:CMP-2-keto-3-deoxyoctulosonic acid synthetase